MADMFPVPVVLFMFKRKDTTIQIMRRIREVRPQRLYLMADAGRNAEERKLVAECRKAVEEIVDWPCELIKNYAEKNRGVYAQIGLGAKWVFEREEAAIFLEDDNLPELSFFIYCKECLSKYKEDEKVFWICGTNYLQKCEPKDGASVFASKHLMPCGWASWAWKFNKYYDDDLKLTEKSDWEKELLKHYRNKSLGNQQRRSIKGEWEKKQSGKRYNSWDFHLVLSMRMNDLVGIVPKYNQIKNIGVDEFSTHGGSSISLEMTKRFCGIDSFELSIPLVLPDAKQLDDSFEKSIGEIILYPLKARIILYWREKLNLPPDVRLRQTVQYLIGKKKV